MSAILSSIVHWAARVTAILIAAAFLMFVVSERRGLMQAIHFREWIGMLFLIGAILFMLLAWKWEFPAALISLFALGAFAAVVHMRRVDVPLVMAIPNFLFLLDWKLRHSPST